MIESRQSYSKESRVQFFLAHPVNVGTFNLYDIT